jgi:hypothetical protein
VHFKFPITTYQSRKSLRLCLAVEKLRPWGNIFAVASIAVWTVLVALDSPYADVAMLLLPSFTLFMEWIALFERRAKRTIWACPIEFRSTGKR